MGTAVTTVISSGATYNNRGSSTNKRDHFEICSETDSTNECSDFKSELDDDMDPDPTQQQQSSIAPSSVGSGSTGASSSVVSASGTGQGAGPPPAGAPRKSSGVRKNTRVVFV